jgi:hypothetical protein
MAKNNEAKMYIKILTIVIILYVVYVSIIIVSNALLKETKGEIIFEHNYEEHLIWFSKGRYSGKNMPYEEDVLRKDIYYKYFVNGNEFTNKRISNILIYPSNEYYTGDKIRIYYNRLMPKYSILYKWDILYFFYNLLPIIILLCINIFLRNKYRKNKKQKRRATAADTRHLGE